MRLFPVAAGVAIAAMFSCGALQWQPIFKSSSPDGRYIVTVLEQRLGPDSSVHIKLLDKKSGEDRVIHRAKGDRSPSHCEAVWSADSKRVGILVCDRITENILLGYDISRSLELSKEAFLGKFREALINRYHVNSAQLLPHDGDPVAWACSSR